MAYRRRPTRWAVGLSKEYTFYIRWFATILNYLVSETKELDGEQQRLARLLPSKRGQQDVIEQPQTAHSDIPPFQ